MPLLDILQGVVQVAKLVYDEAQRAKANQAQCKRLVERIKIIVDSTKKLESVKDSGQYDSGLKALKLCLDNCLIFIKKFSKDDNWFKQVFKAGASEKEFAQLNDELEKAISQLNLGLSAQQIMNREQDKLDQKEDFSALQKQQKTIIDLIEKDTALNQENNQTLHKIGLDQKEQHVIVQNRLASLARRFDALLTEKPQKQKTFLDPTLTIPYYELQFYNRIAEGSLGKIYLGQWAYQPVAIKTLEGKFTKADTEEFIREVKILSRLRHRNIIQLYGACLEPERLCLIMEYMNSGSLYSLLHSEKSAKEQKETKSVNQSLTADQQKHCILEIVKGLAFLHQRGIFHGDFKSANILVGAHLEMKIADFGLSQTKTASIAPFKKESQAVQWMAPECFERDKNYTAQSDIYSFGVIMWEIVTGKIPFADCKDNIPKKILSGEREKIPATVPAVYQKLIQQCWEKDPYKRPSLDNIIREISAYQPDAELTGEQHYQRGLEHERSSRLTEAREEYQKSMKKGYYKAHTNLGFFSLKGLGGLQTDRQQAFQYFSYAAEKGHPRAMSILAIMHELGDGIPKNEVEALKWYDKAASAGDSQASTKSQNLRSKLVSNSPASPVAAAAGTNLKL